MGKLTETFERWKSRLMIAGVALGGMGITAIEIVADEEEVSAFEFVYDSIEKSLILVGAIGVFVLLKQMREQQQERKDLAKQLEVARLEGREWRQRAQSFVNGVGEQIESQFLTWGLSEAEIEVGLLMIKGLSHKEIADIRGTAEATIRQQARAIYQKSGLPGKAAFSAYFLEDLLPPSKSQQN